MESSFLTSGLIAPCGMNCGLCIYLHDGRGKCNGCNEGEGNKPVFCAKCVIKRCETVRKNGSGLCYDCDAFPCKRIKTLDARYRKNYGMSMIENLIFIKENGMDAFLDLERERRTCRSCGNLLCIHRKECMICGTSLSADM